MRGVILAGGKGTRLLPATRVTNKHMLPILNRPMIEYPLGTLKEFGCTDILVVSGGNHIGHIAEYLGDGSSFGVRLTYKVQKEAGGIAEALGLAEDFVEKDEDVLVILGDNIFEPFKEVPKFEPGFADVFVKEVSNPERFGVLDSPALRIIEKPKDARGNKAVVGLYHYPFSVFEIVKGLKPSARGELEITDVNNAFLKISKCFIRKCEGFWSDAGTPESLVEVINWVSTRK